MNRIVIVGNGFDLAHGLKTSYADFALDLINSDFEMFRNEERQPEHGLYYFELSHEFQRQKKFPLLIERVTSLKSLDGKESDVEWRLDYKDLDQYRRPQDFNIPWEGEKISVVVQSELFMKILTRNGWADIEKEYYNQLVDIFKKSKKRNLIKLNQEFSMIKKLLLKYLEYENKVEIDKNYSIKNLIHRIEGNLLGLYTFFDDVTKQRMNKEFGFSQLENLVFLNFNYTHTLSKLYGFRNALEIPIHGTILDEMAVVFGYGDEKSEFHEKLESADEDEWIRFFKSHYYGSRSYYSQLLGVLEADIFDVVIIGHSLGLSDRLMLQTIFEHENCKFIHLAHTGGDSHFRKRIAISRHFNDKKLMRSRLLEENESLKFNRTPD